MVASNPRTDQPGDGLRMYDEMADWFHLLTPPTDYAEEAGFILGILQSHALGPLETLVEFGSGGGNTASHLKAHLALTLTDPAPTMLQLSRTINPECEHLEADMRTARLGRTFDAVLIHDAVMYMTTPADLSAALETAFTHLRPGGAAIFAPDCTRETFVARTSHGGHDGDPGDPRALRYLEWTYDPDPADTSFLTDFAILLREGASDVRVRYDRHGMGLFSRDTWLALIAEVGFVADAVEDPWGRTIFVGVRPG